MGITIRTEFSLHLSEFRYHNNGSYITNHHNNNHSQTKILLLGIYIYKNYTPLKKEKKRITPHILVYSRL